MGSSEYLFKLLDQKEFGNDVPVNIVKYGVETAEELKLQRRWNAEEFLEWVAFKKHLIKKIDRQARLGQIKVNHETEYCCFEHNC